MGIPDLSASGWAQNSAVVRHFMQLLGLLWSSSSKSSRQNEDGMGLVWKGVAMIRR